MNKRIFELHAEICKTFTNPKRLEILDLLRAGEKSVNELVQLAGINQSNLSQHLAILRGKGIVQTRRDGLNIYYSITNPKIIKAFDIMREILYEQLALNENLAKELEVGGLTH